MKHFKNYQAHQSYLLDLGLSQLPVKSSVLMLWGTPARGDQGGEKLSCRICKSLEGPWHLHVLQSATRSNDSACPIEANLKHWQGIEANIPELAPVPHSTLTWGAGPLWLCYQLPTYSLWS